MNTLMSDPGEGEFDLQPDPRVLPMLGEINIEQWRCLAELIDNAIDGFLHAKRGGNPVEVPRVDVSLPSADKEGAQVKISDSGLGMSPEVLEKAVRAGYSGNNPIDNLGLFGMGFNIATARLGSVTEVWTTKSGDPEWHGLSIDFDQLRRQRHFRTAHLRRPKIDTATQGTEITIKKLKPEERKWLAKSSNQSSIKKRLSQAYSSMLRQSGDPISFSLFMNNKRVEARKHCTWDETRFVSTPDGGTVAAVRHIDFPMSDRLYCTSCMTWVPEAMVSGVCPICGTAGSLTKRSRRVRGWIGIQRYLDQTEFGLDFIRNGRKIEIANKDLFFWRDGETEEREYPIDDPRGRGRIVGEIHIDHCRVSYAKDRFDRNDPSWDEMVQLIRGEGPLRPEKAKTLGFLNNDSPLFSLFKTFRRTSPHSKTAGAYARILVVKENDRAVEMARLFHDSHPEYQDDTKWWELVEEADRELLYGAGKGKGGVGDDVSGESRELPAGLLDVEESTTSTVLVNSEPTAKLAQKDHTRWPVPSLSRKYAHRSSSTTWNVNAFEVEASDPDLPSGAPWRVLMADVATRNYHFLYNPGHPTFRSITMTPRDALLSHLAWMTSELLRTTRETPEFGLILSELREEYGEGNTLDFKTMAADATEILGDVAKAFVASCPEEDRAALFNDLPLNEQQSVMRALAVRKIKPTSVTADGSFLQFAPYEIVRALMQRYPELCFDGRIWDAPYDDLDYGDDEITTSARQGILARYLGLVSDAIWLARQDASDLAASTREELIRATMSLRLLRPDVELT